jgi:K+-sensing histidine kinase KdpD
MVTAAQPWSRYVTPALLSGLLVVVALALPWPIPRAGLVFLGLLVVMVSAYLGGFGPGLLATAIWGLGMAYLLPPNNSFSIQARSDMITLGIFASAAALASFVLGYMDQQSTPEIPDP